MNDNDESLPEELIADSLAPLREVAVPDKVRAANRAAIARALARHTRRPWWQRTVAVPVPLAIAATVAILGTTVALLLPISGRQSAEHNTPQLKAELVAAADATPNSGDPPLQAWSITRSYIQTIESLPAARVISDFDKQEKRDDS